MFELEASFSVYLRFPPILGMSGFVSIVAWADVKVLLDDQSQIRQQLLWRLVLITLTSWFTIAIACCNAVLCYSRRMPATASSAWRPAYLIRSNPHPSSFAFLYIILPCISKWFLLQPDPRTDSHVDSQECGAGARKRTVSNSLGCSCAHQNKFLDF